MEIEQALDDFRRRLLLATHLQPFLQKNPLIIKLEVKEYEGHYIIKMANEVIEITKNNGKEDVDIVIGGEERAVTRLINGRDRLQRLEKNDLIIIEGKYSAILKAETIFYLNQ